MFLACKIIHQAWKKIKRKGVGENYHENLDFSSGICYANKHRKKTISANYYRFTTKKGELMPRHLLFTIDALVLLIAPSVWTGCSMISSASESSEEQVVAMRTTKGKFVFELYPDSAPVTVENFKKLIKKRFYNGLTFHRKVDNQSLNIIQGGDPKGDGTGGPGYTIVDEYSHPNQRPHLRGIVAMARTNAPNSAGSQFYICLKPQPHLDGRYTTFGRLIQGMDVVDQLEIGDIIKTVRLEVKSKYVTPQ